MTTNQTVTGQGMPVSNNIAIGGVQAAEVSETTTLRPQNAIRRDTTRYIVMAGDLMTEDVKRGFRAISASQLGGQWFSPVEIPCLWKFQGFVHRGRITPLIKKSVRAWQDETISKKKATDIAEIRGAGGIVEEVQNAVYRPEFPYDSMQSILSDRSAASSHGFTEVTALEGVDWETGIVQDIQHFIFKDWDAITAGAQTLPFLTREFVALINSRRNETRESAIIDVCEAFLESADKFRTYATAKVSESVALARRAVNDKGFAVGVSAYARHLAMQIEMEVEAPTIQQTVAAMTQNNQPAPTQITGMSAEELALKERELNLREQEMQIKRIELGLDQNPAKVNIIVADAPPVNDNPPVANSQIIIEQPKQKTDAPKKSFKIGALVKILIDGDFGNAVGEVTNNKFGKYEVKLPDGSSLEIPVEKLEAFETDQELNN